MRALSAAVVTSLLLGSAQGQPAPSPQLPPIKESFVFKAMPPSKRPNEQTQIDNGLRVAHPEMLFPGALYADLEAKCSATLVGPNAMVTAQHCLHLAAERHLPIAFEYGSKHINADCEQAPGRDAVLCVLQCPVPGEYDGLARTPVAVMDKVILSGWADPRPPPFAAPFIALGHGLGWLLGARHSFRIGAATVIATGPRVVVAGDLAAGGPVVADPGDSGGAAYEKSGHAIVGVNICGGPGCKDGANAGTTTLANLTDAAAVAWICDWMSRTKATVCGYSSDPASCVSEPSPHTPPTSTER